MRVVKKKSIEEIALEWDIAAPIRYAEIAEGRDKSYTEFLLPLFRDIFCHGGYKNVIDVGCGLGFVSAIAGIYCDYVVGVDISRESIRIAEEHNKRKNVKYVLSTVENFKWNDQFDCIIANMVFMDCPELQEFINGCYKLAALSADIHIVTINPNVWPRYWGYEKNNWFNYNKEIFIEAPFRTSYGGYSGFLSTHIHRSLAAQINQIISSGFEIEELKEISGVIPKNTILSKYPRYIYIKATKRSRST